MNDVIQPPPKKQRIGVDSALANTNIEQLEVKTRSLYFDLQPENALDNIVRFRSRSPWAINWPNHTLLEDILDLFGVAGELGRFLLGRFTGVYVISDLPHWIEMYFDNIGVKNDEAIICRPEFLWYFIKSGRVIPSFKSILVGGKYRLHSSQMKDCDFDSLSKQWPNIRRLIFLDQSVGNWFETFGKDLESLCVLESWAESPTMMKITTYCTKLRHLVVKGDFWKGVDPDMFWKMVGKHLETLCARYNQESESQNHYISKYCPNIKRLELLGSINGIPECIAFYGVQVEEAKIDFGTENDMKLLSSACPNARFSLSTRSKRESRMALDILGPHLKALEILGFDYGIVSDGLPADWNSCTNLESVKFHGFPKIEDIRCFMEKPKPLLKCIEFPGARNGFKKEQLKEFISLLSRGTGALEKLIFSCHEPSLGLFKSLAKRNKNLGCVQIYFSCTIPDVKKLDVMESFLKCPLLKRLVLVDYSYSNMYMIPGMKALLCSLRHRSIYISVFGKIIQTGLGPLSWPQM